MTTPCTFIPITRARPGLEGQVSDSLQRSQVKKLLMKSSTGAGRQTAASSLCIKPPTRLWADSFNKFGYFSSTWINRLEICRDRHDRRSCKNISNYVNFSWKQGPSLQNLRRSMKFTHLFGEFTHPFLQIYWNFTNSFYSIIYIEIYRINGKISPDLRIFSV